MQEKPKFHIFIILCCRSLKAVKTYLWGSGSWCVSPALYSGRQRSPSRSTHSTKKCQLRIMCNVHWCFEGLWQRLLTYLEYRAVSGVFQILTPHPPLHPATVSSPPHQRGVGGYTLAGQWGVNILEDARHWIGFLQYNLSTVCGYGVGGRVGCPQGGRRLEGWGPWTRRPAWLAEGEWPSRACICKPF